MRHYHDPDRITANIGELPTEAYEDAKPEKFRELLPWVPMRPRFHRRVVCNRPRRKPAYGRA